MSFRRLHLSIMILLALFASLLLTPAAQAQVAGGDPPAPNPDLGVSCGDQIEMALVLDASGSVAGFDAVDQVREIGLAITDGLANRNINMAVIEYASVADTPIPSTPLTSATARSIFNPYFDGTGSTSYYDGRIGRFTNWDDGLRQTSLLPATPDLVIFVSDGTPNTIGDAATAVDGNASIEEAAAEAGGIANTLKAEGAHIVAIGVAGLNDDIGADLLRSLSGDDDLETSGLATGDFFIGEFTDLERIIDQFARDLCGGTATINSIIDADGDLATTSDQTPAVGWPIEIDRTNGEFDLSSDATNENGTVILAPDWDLNGNSNFEFWLSQPPLAGHYVVSGACRRVGEPGKFDAGFRVRNLEMARRSLMECTFINAPLPYALGFDLQTTSIEDVDTSGTNSIGDIVHYRAIATNEGGGILTDVTIGSDLVEWTTCAPAQGSSLSKGESLICEGTHTITGDEIGGRIVHDATAAAIETGVLNDQEVTALPVANLEIDKDVIRIDDVDNSDDQSVGDVIHYRVEATNIGEDTLTGVLITDPSIANLSCTPIGSLTLRPGQGVVCSGSRVIETADLDTTIPNTATVTSDQTGDLDEGEAVPVPALGIRFDTEIVDKYDDLDGNGSPSRGDIIYVVNVATNIGGANLTGFAIKDALSTPLTCETTLPRLAPGEVRECQTPYEIKSVDHGTTLINDATATSIQTGDVPDSDTFVVPSAELTVTSVFDRLEDRDDSLDASPGDDVWFRFIAQNTGEMTLTDVDFTPQGVSDVTCVPQSDRLLVGEFIECKGKRPIVEADMGTAVAASATATSWQAPEASDDASEPVGIPAATLEKIIIRNDDLDRNDRITVGDVLRYEIRIANTGSANVSNVVLEDSLVMANCGGWTDGLINAGETVVCEAAVTVTRDHVGQTITNTASVTSTQLEELSDSVAIDIPLAAACQTGSVLFDDTVVLMGHLPTSVTSAVAIESGVYALRVVGADELHEAGYQTSQTMESFFVEFLDAEGRVIAVSNGSADIPDADIWSKSSVEGNVELGRNATAVRARHVGSNGANSVSAVCVELDRVGDAVAPFAEPGEIRCSDNAIVFNQLLISNTSDSTTTTTALVPAGSYSVSLVSEDVRHQAGQNTEQMNEQWKLQFLDADGALIAETAYSTDLGDAEIRRIDQVGTAITLDREATSMRLVADLGEVPNSVHAVCAELQAM